MFETHPILDSLAPVSTQCFSKSDPSISHQVVEKTQPSMKSWSKVAQCYTEVVEERQLQTPSPKGAQF